MSILTHALGQSCQLLTTTTNKFGDQVESTRATVSCRLRYITELNAVGNTEGLDAFEAMVWFEPDVDVSEGTIFKADGVYWRIDRLTKARRLVGSQVMFLKALVNRHRGDFNGS